MPKGVESSQKQSSPITLFVNNLPPGWPALGLRKIFSWHGTVNRVFISKKLSKTGTIFGFVTVTLRKNPEEIIKILNGSWLGNHRLAMAFARPNPRNSPRTFPHSNSSSFNKGPNRNKMDSRSFAQVLQYGKSNVSGKRETLDLPYGSFEYSSVESENSWLKRSVVGWLHRSLNFSTIQDQLLEWGFLDCTCRPMGGNLVLLTFPTDDLYSKFFNSDTTWLGQWFEKIKPWESDVICSVRFASIRCEGVPLHAWNSDFFANIANLSGSFIGVDEDTRLKRRLDIARILISTSMPEHIDIIIKPKIDGLIFPIRVVEEPLILFPRVNQSYDNNVFPGNRPSLDSSDVSDEDVGSSCKSPAKSGDSDCDFGARVSQKLEENKVGLSPTLGRGGGGGSNSQDSFIASLVNHEAAEEDTIPMKHAVSQKLYDDLDGFSPSHTSGIGGGSKLYVDGPVQSNANSQVEGLDKLNLFGQNPEILATSLDKVGLDITKGVVSSAKGRVSISPPERDSLSKVTGNDYTSLSLPAHVSSSPPSHAPTTKVVVSEPLTTPSEPLTNYDVDATTLPQVPLHNHVTDFVEGCPSPVLESPSSAHGNPNESLVLYGLSRKRKSKSIKEFYLLDPLNVAVQFPKRKISNKSCRKKKVAVPFSIATPPNYIQIFGSAVGDDSISDNGIKNMNSMHNATHSSNKEVNQLSEGEKVWELAVAMGLGSTAEKDDFVRQINSMDAEDKAVWNAAYPEEEI